MPMALSRLTQLDSVNEILSAVGEKPVGTLEGQTSMMATLALNELTSTSRHIQMEDWEFNRVRGLVLSVDATSGFVGVPAHLTRVDVPEEPQTILRGSRLYDRNRNSYVFTSAQTINAIALLDWDDLPEEARSYIASEAAYRLYCQHVGAQEGKRQLYQRVMMTRSTLTNYDAEIAGYSMLDDFSLPRLHGSSLVPGAPTDGFKPNQEH